MIGLIEQITPYERARRYVAKIPGAIEGNHGDCQTLAVANALLWDFALSPSEALAILREFNTRCSPQWTDADLIRKLQSAERQPHSKPRGNLIREDSSSLHALEWKRSPSSLREKHIDSVANVENFLKDFRCDEADLWEASPIRLPTDWTEDAIALLGNLYDTGERINFVTAFKQTTKRDGTIKTSPGGYGMTMERDQLINCWREHGMPISEAGGWLRMNPMDGDGVDDKNVTAFRFALLESDKLPLSLLLALFARLPLPITTILTSAGRSYHAWVRVGSDSLCEYRDTVEEMISLLARFGIDTGNKNPSRLSRLPGVVRCVGAVGDGRQRLLYLNPHPAQKRIL